MIACQQSAKNSQKANSKTSIIPSEKLSLKNEEKEVQEEQLLGKLLLETFIRDYGSYHENKNLNKYIQLAGNTISYQFGRSELIFKFGILDTDEINAFSLPGGLVFLTRGLLEKIENESELAAVMGHEIAHINQKHIFNSVRKERELGFAETLSSILSMGKASMSGAMQQAIGEATQLLRDKGMSKENEFEADEYGVNFAAQSGYLAESYLDLLKRLKKISMGTNLSNTHPPFDERIQRIERLINSKDVANELKWDKSLINQRFQVAMLGLKK